MEDAQIGLFKLISGEEIVTEYTSDEQFYLFRAPRKIVLVQVSPTEARPRLMPWMIGDSNGTFPVYSGHVITPSATMDESLKTAYLQDVSGLDLSATTPKKIVV